MQESDGLFKLTVFFFIVEKVVYVPGELLRGIQEIQIVIATGSH